MLIHNQYHLTYCTNIHPGEHWEEYFQSLQQHLPAVKAQVSPDAPFGVGLRLSARAAEELMLMDYIDEFKSWLKKEGLYVFTINGFPYGNFHHEAVKDNVYKPDWCSQERILYTKNLCHVLAYLLPEGMEGSISTAPLTYKPWLAQDEQQTDEAHRVCSMHLSLMVEELVKIKAVTGKNIYLAIEPEPDGLIENTSEIISFYDYWLHPTGADYLNNALGLTSEAAREAILNHIRICYDICHFSLAYEQPEAVFSRLEQEGIKIGKIQISAAIKVSLADINVDLRGVIASELTQFAESTYLHQVVERDDKGNLNLYSDLPEALDNIHQTEAREWRIHFHVPVFLQQYKLLQSTQSDIHEVLRLLKHHKLCSHLEVETYTWEVLPDDLKTDLDTSIQRELQWVTEQIEIYMYA
jgi:hypothetical protein